MDLAQLYKKHDQDKQIYEATRNKTWAEMKQRHENLIAAFQSRENLPEGYAKQIDKEIDDFSKDWAIPHGNKYEAMVLQQAKQVKSIVSNLTPSNDKAAASPNSGSAYQRSLASTRYINKSEQREKNPEKFKNLDQNKDSMDLGYG